MTHNCRREEEGIPCPSSCVCPLCTVLAHSASFGILQKLVVGGEVGSGKRLVALGRCCDAAATLEIASRYDANDETDDDDEMPKIEDPPTPDVAVAEVAGRSDANDETPMSEKKTPPQAGADGAVTKSPVVDLSVLPEEIIYGIVPSNKFINSLVHGIVVTTDDKNRRVCRLDIDGVLACLWVAARSASGMGLDGCRVVQATDYKSFAYYPAEDIEAMLHWLVKHAIDRMSKKEVSSQ